MHAFVIISTLIFEFSPIYLLVYTTKTPCLKFLIIWRNFNLGMIRFFKNHPDAYRWDQKNCDLWLEILIWFFHMWKLSHKNLCPGQDIKKKVLRWHFLTFKSFFILKSSTRFWLSGWIFTWKRDKETLWFMSILIYCLVLNLCKSFSTHGALNYNNTYINYSHLGLKNPQ